MCESESFLGGEGRGEGVYPRVLYIWKHPSPRASPRKSGERERLTFRKWLDTQRRVLNSDAAMPSLLQIDNLKVVFHGDAGRTTRAVDGVSLALARGRTLGVVGESGSGKSVTFLAVMGLLPARSAEVSGRIRFDGLDLLTLPDPQLRDLRGDRLAMIFQEPMTSLNPSYTIGEQIIEVFMRHRGLTRRDARRQALPML